MVFTVTNGGQTPTGALAVAPPAAGFVVASNGCTTAMGAGATCTIALQLAPGRTPSTSR